MSHQQQQQQNVLVQRAVEALASGSCPDFSDVEDKAAVRDAFRPGWQKDSFMQADQEWLTQLCEAVALKSGRALTLTHKGRAHYVNGAGEELILTAAASSGTPTTEKLVLFTPSARPFQFATSPQ